MKKTLTAVSAALVALGLAAPAEAAPRDTPALMCSLGTVDVQHPPIGYDVTPIFELARRLGLGDPGAVGLGCDKGVRTDPYSEEIQPYPERGPVVLRSQEPGKGSTQLYCTDSRGGWGKMHGLPVEVFWVVGTGCVSEANPVVI
ncbi:hypothetical protein [Streptomyces laurentii]